MVSLKSKTMKKILLAFAMFGMFVSCDQEATLQPTDQFPKEILASEFIDLQVSLLSGERIQYKSLTALNEKGLVVTDYSGNSQYYELILEKDKFVAKDNVSETTFKTVEPFVTASRPGLDPEPDCTVDTEGGCSIEVFGHYTYSEVTISCPYEGSVTTIENGPGWWWCIIAERLAAE